MGIPAFRATTSGQRPVRRLIGPDGQPVSADPISLLTAIADGIAQLTSRYVLPLDSFPDSGILKALSSAANTNSYRYYDKGKAGDSNGNLSFPVYRIQFLAITGKFDLLFGDHRGADGTTANWQVTTGVPYTLQWNGSALDFTLRNPDTANDCQFCMIMQSGE